MNRYAWKRKGLLTAIVAVVVCCYCDNSQAAFTSVSSRATLAGTDFIDWGTLGPENTFLGNPFTATSNGGIDATLSQVANPFLILQQSPSTQANFAPGDFFVWTHGDNGPMTIMFGTAVTAAGTQIQTSLLGDFTGEIDALAADSTTVLASYNYSGNSNVNGDNSAVFAGISASGTDMFYGIRITGLTATVQPNSFAINRLDFTPAAAPPAAVPVPAGIVLMLTGLPVLGFAGWTRRRTAKA